MTAPDRFGVYAWSPGTGGVHHHRIAEPLRVLADNGYPCSTGVELDDTILERVDTVLAHTLHGEHETEAWQILARQGSHRLVFDVDDAMWCPDWKPFQDNYTPEALARLYANVRAAHVVTTPSPVIAAHLSKYNRNTWVLPNTVPAWLVDHTPPPWEALTVGYQGSTHHIRDWPASQQRQLARFLAEHPDWLLHIYGNVTVDGPPGRVKVTPWTSSIGDYYRTLSLDVGIGPLAATRFNAAKSSLRAVEYAALGIVAVLPDMAPYRGWVEDGVTGVLVKSHQTLSGVLRAVAADDEWRQKMSATARERARGWTTEACIGEWVQAWDSR